MIFTIYSIFFLATALVSFLIAFLAWQRRLVKGAKEITALMIAAGVGVFWLIFEAAATTIPGKIFWSKLEYFGGVATPVLYLIFVLRFTGKDKFITWKYVLMLFTIPLITLALALTNEQHNLIWSGFSAISEKTNLMIYYHGIGFWIGYMGYTYVMLMMATILLFSFIFRQNKPFRSQGLIVLISGLCPWITSVIYLTGMNPVPGLDITPVSITLSGMLAAYGIFYVRFLDLVPVARKTLVEILPDGILALDGQNRIQDINGAALNFLGIPNKYIIGFPALSSGASVTELLNAVIDRESVEQLEIRNSTETRVFRIIKHDIQNQQGSRLVVIRDITEQVAWQKEIQAGEERYRHMVNMFRLLADNTDDFLWAKDINNQYTFANKTICDRLLVATDVNEPIGKTDIFFADRQREAHPENPDWHTFGEICANSDIITINEAKPKQFDEFGNIKGEFLFLDVHKAPIWDEYGNLIGVVGTARDATHTKQLELEKSVALESLQKSEDNLRKINAEKDKFFSIIAHDLRNPLSGFLKLTQLMSEVLPSLTMEEIQDITLTMRNSATNLYRLLGNLLQWARIQQGTIAFNPELFNLSVIVDESIAMVRESANNKGIEIIHSIPDDLMIFADTNILQTILRNHVSNAVKFTAKGGKVHLAAKLNGGNSVEISIRDTGIGMSREMIDNLFRLDVQTNRIGTEGEPSTGLGLFLCKEFIEKHGGKISVESEVGKGSVFTFTIPFDSELMVNNLSQS